MRKKLITGALTLLAVVLGIGWLTSSRQIDMVFLQDGVPLAGCDVKLISSRQSEPEVFPIGSKGEVRFPASLAGKKGVYAIFREGEQLHSLYEESFDRGLTTVNFLNEGMESEHAYHFLFYNTTTRSSSIDLKRVDSEQGDTDHRVGEILITFSTSS